MAPKMGPIGKASSNSLWHQYRFQARKRGYKWQLTRSQFLEIVSRSCYYCGVAPSNVIIQTGGCRKTPASPFVYSGIDRANNTRGYIFKNCRAACGICNHAKTDLTVKEFEKWIDKLIKIRRKRHGN